MNKKYYSSNRIMGYNKPWNFSLGNRNTGKTFEWKKRCIRNFLRKGEEFVYLTRSKVDLDEVFDGLFGDIVENDVFPGIEIEYKNRIVYINGDLAGYGLVLKDSDRIKRKSMPKVTTIWFDEFLESDSRYLRNEFNKAQSIYQTIARGTKAGATRDNVRFIFSANHLSVSNPYFRGLGVRFNINAKYQQGESYVIESFHNEDIANEISSSSAGSILNMGLYGTMAQGSKFMLDSDAHIEKMPKSYRYLLTINHDGESYGLCMGNDDKYYVTDRVDPNCSKKYVFSNEDHTLHTQMIDTWGQSQFFHDIREYYLTNKVFFVNQDCKRMFIEIMNYT